MPPRPILAAAAVAAASLLAGTRAGAWLFDEHTELGSQGYRDACADLARDLRLDVQPKPAPAGRPAPPDPCMTAANDTTARWCLACRNFPPLLYGQSVAIAGDHVGTPAELMSSSGQIVAASVANYASLALENVTHFHPEAARTWRAFHDDALVLATKDYPSGPAARDFALVFYTAAFADHFLQDAFAAGHAGFNRPASGAVASKAFHDVWNQTGRLVKSATGACWVQYGDGKLRSASVIARAQIDAAERASVIDVLAAFVTGKRDLAREARPLFYMPAAITPNPLPGPVWGIRGALSTSNDPAHGSTPKVIDEIYRQQKEQQAAGCVASEMVPIDGISNPALINGAVDFWARWGHDGRTDSASVDVLYNHRLFSAMSLPVFWEGGLGMGYMRRDDRNGWAPAGVLGMIAPPLYLIHGLLRNDLGAQVRGTAVVNAGPNAYDGHATVFLRSSVEAASVIGRVQAGPTIDVRNGRWGFMLAAGFEFAGTRWITGGGALEAF